MKFNLKQKCLLDASGELTDAAREALREEAAESPQVKAEYETARENFAVFSALPIPEPSAAERKYIPAMIKRSIHGALLEREKRAGRMALLSRWAAGGLAVAACVGIFAGLLIRRHDQNVRMQTQATQIHAMIDGGTLAAAMPAPRPVVITTPSENEENGMNSVAVAPEEPRNMDASAPPGSF